jgi:hypothetical protein
LLIVFIGPDGSGKTTVATQVKLHLEESGATARFFLELNYGILPRFRDIFSFLLRTKVGKSHEPGEYLAGMKHGPNSPLKSTVYMLWYGIDYFIGRFKYDSSGNNQHVIFARFVYDYGYQRAYSRAPRIIYRLVLALSPKPDFVFTIIRDGKEIFNGKPELTVEEIRRQQDSINSLLAGKPYFHVLDGKQGVDATVASALALIDGSALV